MSKKIVNHSSDRRIRKTKKLLVSGLISLLNTKNINEISVKELTELVDINRSTFYFHYKDIYNMMDELENEMYCGIKEILDNYSIYQVRNDLTDILNDLYDFFLKNDNIFYVWFYSNINYSFVNKIKELIKNKYFSEWFIIINNTKQIMYYEYYFEYVMLGIFGVIQLWFKNKNNLTIAELANLTKHIITKGAVADK